MCVCVCVGVGGGGVLKRKGERKREGDEKTSIVISAQRAFHTDC